MKPYLKMLFNNFLLRFIKKENVVKMILRKNETLSREIRNATTFVLSAIGLTID